MRLTDILSNYTKKPFTNTLRRKKKNYFIQTVLTSSRNSIWPSSNRMLKRVTVRETPRPQIFVKNVINNQHSLQRLTVYSSGSVG